MSDEITIQLSAKVASVVFEALRSVFFSKEFVKLPDETKTLVRTALYEATGHVMYLNEKSHDEPAVEVKCEDERSYICACGEVKCLDARTCWRCAGLPDPRKRIEEELANGEGTYAEGID